MNKTYFEEEILQYLKEKFPNDKVIQNHLTTNEIKKVLNVYWNNIASFCLKGQVVRVKDYFSLYLKSSKPWRVKGE